MKNLYTFAYTFAPLALAIAFLVSVPAVSSVDPVTNNPTLTSAVAYAQYYDEYSGIGDVGGYTYESPSYSYDYNTYGGLGDVGSYSLSSYDYTNYSSIGSAGSYSYNPVTYDFTNYNGLGDSGLYSYNPVTYDFTNYTGIGDTNSGCCDATTGSYNYANYTGIGEAGIYSYNPVSYDYTNYSGIGDTGTYSLSNPTYTYTNYTGIGDAGAYSYNNITNTYDYTNYTGIGDAGSGCCDDAAQLAYDYSNYTGIGDAGPGCCDNTTQLAYDYTNYTGIGDAGPGCCDALTPIIYTPQEPGVAPIVYQEESQLVYAPIDYSGAIYSGYSYTPYNYSYTTGGGYSYTPYSYSNQTYNPYVPPTYTNRPTCTLSADDTSISDGDSTELSWTTNNATSVSINYGIGSVSRNGSEEVSPVSTRTYVLTATNSAGSVQCSETIRVDEEDSEVSCDAFTVSDASVDEGDEVTLRWRTTGADDVSINNGIGDVSDDGSERVTIDEDTTFTLTARNGSDVDTCRVRVDVSNGTSDDIPRCRLTVSDTEISLGQSVSLLWDNLRTDRIVLKDSYGILILDSNKNTNVNEDKDSIVLKPTRSTDYTLTVYNGSEKRTCTVGTKVDTVTVSGIRTQDGVPLTQVPYTGFEAGPVLTFIFYAAIVLWALVMAYVLVMRKSATAATELNVNRADLALQTAIATAVAEVPTREVVDYESTVPANFPARAIQEVEERELVSAGDTLRTLEEHAHEQYALVSSDAFRFIESQGVTIEDQIATLNHIISLAKARYPKEHDWIIINKERVMSLLG